jgi:hypothetical protein
MEENPKRDSINSLHSHQPNHPNIDMLANKRKWENEKRGTLISADASRLYQTSTKINSEIDKRLGNSKEQRNSNNRESLQSRLLERINTKKQPSPNEIYLEEELSSDGEEDEDVRGVAAQ